MKRNQDADLICDLKGGKRILLHACCAPCSLAIVEWLSQRGIRPVVFFYNPNIMPQKEYEHRRDESRRHAEQNGLEWIEGRYDPEGWLKNMNALEERLGIDLKREPERGLRCKACFEMRLKESFRVAEENGIEVVATTLASSRWKDIRQVNQVGEGIAIEYQNSGKSVLFWSKNWRIDGLQERRNQLLREGDFYNQLYCGCPYSLRQMGGEQQII